MQRRTFCAAALVALTIVAAPAAAETYPTRTIRIVVPYAPGGSVDVVARLLASRLTEHLGSSVIVENRVGAAGAVGANAVAKAEPDGYTLLFTANSTHTTVPHVSKSVPYDPLADFTPVAAVLDYSFFLVVNPSVRAKTLAELTSQARTSKDGLNFSSAGVGSGPHLAGELLKSATGVKMVHIPYAGNGPAMNAVISGDVQFLFDTTGTAINQIRAGHVRALAVTSRTRNKELPEVPTIIESGIAEYEVVGWYGFMGPAKLPEGIVRRLVHALDVIVRESAVQERLAAQGFDIVLTKDDDFGNRIRKDHALWGKVVRDAKIATN
jgi:tripartite-type tricarboxylate transporter receptor subunit TctC